MNEKALESLIGLCDEMLVLESYQGSDIIDVHTWYHDEEAVAKTHITKGTIIPHVVHGPNNCSIYNGNVKFKPIGRAVYSRPVSEGGNVAFVKEVKGNTDFYNIIAVKDLRKGEILKYNTTTHKPAFAIDRRS